MISKATFLGPKRLVRQYIKLPMNPFCKCCFVAAENVRASREKSGIQQLANLPTCYYKYVYVILCIQSCPILRGINILSSTFGDPADQHHHLHGADSTPPLRVKPTKGVIKYFCVHCCWLTSSFLSLVSTFSAIPDFWWTQQRTISSQLLVHSLLHILRRWFPWLSPFLVRQLPLLQLRLLLLH